MSFIHPELLLLLLLILPWGWLLFVTLNGSKKKYPFLIYLALGAISVLSLARPVWDPQNAPTPGSGQPTVFLVDVSRSMLSRDISPDRLTVAKEALLRLSPNLDSDTSALAAYAGTTVIISPLTRDRSFLEQAVRTLGPDTVSRGGSKLGMALNQVISAFGPVGKKMAVWVLTDGGDQDSQALEAAKALGKQGHRLYIWGLGSEAGAPVPDRPAVSSLDREFLKSLVNAVPGGAYFDGANQNFTDVYLAHREISSQELSNVVVWKEGAQVLVWVSLGGWIVLLTFRILRRRKLP